MLLLVINFDSCLPVDSFGGFNSQLTGMVAAVEYRTDTNHFFLQNGVILQIFLEQVLSDFYSSFK